MYDSGAAQSGRVSLLEVVGGHLLADDTLEDGSRIVSFHTADLHEYTTPHDAFRTVLIDPTGFEQETHYHPAGWSVGMLEAWHELFAGTRKWELLMIADGRRG